MITQAELKERIAYYPVTGSFQWTDSAKNPASIRGKFAGTKTNKGYIAIQIAGVLKQAHVWAWFYMTGSWPLKDIHHKDRNGLNNAWANLRQASRSVNNQNSGFSGLNYVHRDQYWAVRLKLNGKSKSFKGSKCFGKALKLRMQAKIDLHPSSPETTGLRDLLQEWKQNLTAG